MSWRSMHFKRSHASADSKEARTAHIEDVDASTQVSHSTADDHVDPELLAHYTRYPNRWSRIR